MSSFPNQRFYFFIHFIKKQKVSFIIFLISCLASALSSSIWPFITGKIIDALSVYDGDKSEVFTNLGYLFTAALFFWMFLEFLTRIQGFVSANIYPTFES